MRRTLIAASVFFAATAAFAVDVEHSFQSSIPRGSVQRVIIDIPAAEFTIRNGDANTLAISGIASRDYDGQHERVWAQRVVNDTDVEFYVNGTEAIVRRKWGANASSWRARKFTGLDLRLNLPPGVDVRFETSAGEIDVAGTFGDLDIDLTAGEIKVSVPRNTVKELNASCRIGEVHTNLGTEIVSREGILPGKTHWENTTGRSRLNVHTSVGEVNVTLTQ